MATYQDLLSRTGATRQRDIPKRVLKALNEGAIASVNLVEWLAIDQHALLAAILPQTSLRNHKSLLRKAKALLGLGIIKRTMAFGELIHDAAKAQSAGEELTRTLVSHPADLVRQWGARLVLAQTKDQISAQLAAMRPFAIDDHMGVREMAWLLVREPVIKNLDRALELLQAWTLDDDFRARRFASELTRPRGVWCPHIKALKKHPEKGLPLLEALRSDPERYVQNSVANWLNDASKSHPAWVTEVCERWSQESPTKATQYTVRRALRTIRRKSPKQA